MNKEKDQLYETLEDIPAEQIKKFLSEDVFQNMSNTELIEWVKNNPNLSEAVSVRFLE